MGEYIVRLIADIAGTLLDVQQYFFKRKLKKRRKYEKENKLPRKRMVSPKDRFIVLWAITLVIVVILIRFFQNDKEAITKEKINEIKELLEKEKKVFGDYPEKLETIKRNNPLRIDLLHDGWGNVFNYELKEGYYTLISYGKDGKLNTKDDIKLN
ncbi:type II secretion system protein GspG [Tenacibaculum amylolyticum]|uniref:type II secretion system protein GspG n=1 Tax=Tenacibaculum amylolyticum TaxID=104269 RepID=UPI00389680F6